MSSRGCKMETISNHSRSRRIVHSNAGQRGPSKSESEFGVGVWTFCRHFLPPRQTGRGAVGLPVRGGGGRLRSQVRVQLLDRGSICSGTLLISSLKRGPHLRLLPHPSALRKALTPSAGPWGVGRWTISTEWLREQLVS